MKRQGAVEPSKIYYDVTIDHDPEHKDQRYGVASKAITTINLRDPLIENPGDFNLVITKFKIDTECIPLMIPEMEQPQNLLDDNIQFYNKMKTKYQIEINMTIHTCTKTTIKDKNDNVIKQKSKNEKGEEILVDTLEENEKYEKGAKGYVFVQHHRYYSYAINQTKYLGYAKHDNGDVANYLAYIDNTDEQCFVYSYETFLIGVNQTIQKLTGMIAEAAKQYNLTGTRMYYFSLVNGLLRFCMTKYGYDLVVDEQTVTDPQTGNTINRYLEWYPTRFDIQFSPELYKYLGNGFPCSFLNNDAKKGWWRYNIKPQFTDNGKESRNSYPTMFVDNDKTKYMEQSYSTLSNWNILKAIIIGSDNLPVVEEYLPISNKDGFLTHYPTPEYTKALQDLGIQHSEIREIFKKNTQRVLDIYYPLSASAGDIRSSIIYTCENIQQGQSIELMPASPINHFNVWVKWLDIYGNLYDLYLYPGCSVDIRMCFIKKPLMKEDLAEGLEAVMDCLPEKKEKKEGKSNGKPNGIVIPGVDRHGFIHI